MSLLEQQNLLARVYTDPEFRSSFYADPFAVGSKQGLCEDEIHELLLAAPAEVEFFAESLLWKRFHEVEKILGALKSAMGEEFRREFFTFAARFNASSIRKHYEDALGFCSYLIDREDKLDPGISDAARFEKARLRFFNEELNFQFFRSRYNQDRPTTSHRKWQVGKLGIYFWLRLGKRVVHFRV